MRDKVEHAAYMKEWRARNPEGKAKQLALRREWYARMSPEERKEYGKKKRATHIETERRCQATWYAKPENKAKVIANATAWGKAHPHIRRAGCAKRYADKTRATPPWADLKAIGAIYKEAVATGMHVDHIVPLHGKKVSGLHVHWNLQLLTPEENRKKHNTYEVA